ncbi:glutamate 5-kinase [Halobacteroides halobius DSM 5150]|uniref:Glutamate 5-kinase n=1 Tax=Halobacteroides halobius (strain ATCC 35273 / DSM 5150 / MD-1) TaxID=748449 RepID=L0KBY8_HALHC|nr:glutamate 5-kinase [Halobacteroides halobius]AGB41879.1 glutamate 5-kinase [Halobacteroides halobius DSM 5150]
MRKKIKEAERIVIKIGSSTLTYQNSKLNLGRIEKLIREIVNLKNQGKEVILVSSGAVAAGYGRLKLEASPGTIPEKQALAAIGQGTLMRTYQTIFSEYGYQVGQVLLTQKDLTDRKRYLNSRNTLYQLLDYNVIPVINENDTVAVKEIKFGDNDTLSALVSSLVGADLLVILSDIDGLYTADPRNDDSAKLISQVEEISSEIEELAGGAGTDRGTGGMATKIDAAKIATKAGLPLVIANGSLDQVVTKISEGEDLGTLFLPDSGMTSREQWIAFNLDIAGKIVIDEGATLALTKEGGSLLACGIVEARGEFSVGDVVDIIDQSGSRIAKGLVNYDQPEVDKIKGFQSEEIKSRLGYQAYDEVVHRDNLVLL